MHPRVFSKVLERKIDSLFCWVKTNNLQFDFLTFLDEIFWTSNMSPTHIIDMKKTIKTAKVNKCTKTCETLYSSLNSVANVHFFEETFAIVFNLLFKILSAVYDNICFVV